MVRQSSAINYNDLIAVQIEVFVVKTSTFVVSRQVELSIEITFYYKVIFR
jgi:hypothetical protein